MSVILKSAKKEDVVKHIQEVMGLAAPDGATKDELFAFIIENGGQVGAGVEGGTDLTKGANVDAASGINLKDRVKIRIQKTEGRGGQDDVFVGCNGAGFQIKRGVTIEVPAAVVEVLRDAVKKDLVEVIDDSGNATGSFEYQEVQSYPFEVLN